MQLRNHRHLARAAARGGFTLMELLVVVAILLVLAGTAILTYRSLFMESKMGVAKSMCVTLKGHLESFSMSPLNNGQYPPPDTGFDLLVQRGYLSKIPLDPWGQPYRWTIDPNTQMAVVWSCGPNMMDENGGGDDINSES